MTVPAPYLVLHKVGAGEVQLERVLNIGSVSTWKISVEYLAVHTCNNAFSFITTLQVCDGIFQMNISAVYFHEVQCNVNIVYYLNIYDEYFHSMCETLNICMEYFEAIKMMLNISH